MKCLLEMLVLLIGVALLRRAAARKRRLQVPHLDLARLQIVLHLTPRASHALQFHIQLFEDIGALHGDTGDRACIRGGGPFVLFVRSVL